MKKLLMSIYWKGSILYYHFLSGIKLHKTVMLRMGGTVKNGRHISVDEETFIGKDFLLAVYSINKESLPVGSIAIGKRVAMQSNVRISCIDSVVIEDDALFGSNILIIDNEHGMNPVMPGSYAKQDNGGIKPVHIGKGCWICDQVIILPGSDVGDRSIIGANSVVSGKIPPYSIAVGSPAEVIKKWDFEKNMWVKV